MATPNTQVEQALVPLRQGLDVLWQTARNLQVTNDEEMTEAADVVKAIKKRGDEIENARTALVKPLNDHVKFINNQFKGETERLGKIEVFVKALIGDYRKKQEEMRLAKEAELRKLAADVANTSGDDEFKNMVADGIQISQEKTFRSESGGAAVTFSTVWDFELVDFAKVPDQYKELVNSKVTAAIRSGIREIPGIRIYQREQTRIR